MSEPSHDGQLNKEGTHNVYYNNFDGVAIHANDAITWMVAKEALSLLTWLQQEKPTLEQMANRVGRGIIYVSQTHSMKLPETLAEWHSMLMLPEEYRLLEAKLSKEFHDQVWELLVENSAIPSVEGKLTEVSPIFRVDFDEESGTSKNYLDRIEIKKYTPDMRVIWQRNEETMG